MQIKQIEGMAFLCEDRLARLTCLWKMLRGNVEEYAVLSVISERDGHSSIYQPKKTKPQNTI